MAIPTGPLTKTQKKRTEDSTVKALKKLLSMPELKGLMFNLGLRERGRGENWCELWLTPKGLMEKSGWYHICSSPDVCMSFDHGESKTNPPRILKNKELRSVVERYKITTEELRELAKRLKSS